MRLLVMLAASTMLSTFAHAADDPARSALLSRIETQYLTAAVVAPDSPMVDQWLTDARALNPDVRDADWAGVKSDVAGALTAALTRKGGAFEVFFSGALKTLSTADLKRLSNILGDPAFKKFQGAMASAANQRQLLQTVMGDALSMGEAVNGVLEKHGLKVPH